MAPGNGLDQAATGRKPRAALRNLRTPTGHKTRYGRLLAMTIRWTWFLPS
ncbi:hypothetical protein [Streptomyces marianii]|nr:hypothetical protein [Streptomyces marianii]